MKSLGIIGFGDFGRLAAEYLGSRFETGAYDAHVSADDIVAGGARALTFAQAAACDVVMIAVPVQEMEQVIIALASLVKPGATVVDIASVKVLPSRWLAQHLPDTVHIVPLHPLFGPQSVARDGLAGRQLVICPLRGEQHLKVAALGENLGLRIQITTAEEHDREMAYVQALTHLVGRTLSSMDIPDEMLKTQSYQHLLDLCELLKRDSFALFSAIQTLNPYADEITREFVARASDLLTQAHEASQR
tara:strand:+ start:5192 stop:5932 length:741 start_codon:yes stop_codon:yes gene_type:complete